MLCICHEAVSTGAEAFEIPMNTPVLALKALESYNSPTAMCALRH